MNKNVLIAIAVILGIVFIYLGSVYASHPAANLPSWLPGYQAGSDHVHAKHAIAAFLLGVACFVYAWFQSGNKKVA